MCIKFAFADGQNDIIAADEYHGERHPKHDVFKGHLLSAQTKAVVILGQDGKEDLIVFKSKKVHGCRKYNVDLEVNRGQYRSITITFCSLILIVYFFTILRVKVKHPACLIQTGKKF